MTMYTRLGVSRLREEGVGVEERVEGGGGGAGRSSRSGQSDGAR
jgi:hypothetical protein